MSSPDQLDDDSRALAELGYVGRVRQPGWGVEATAATTFAVFVVIIIVHALLNTFGVSLLSNISAWWHVVGVLIIVAALWLLPEEHQSVSWTLTGWHNETGWSFAPYVFLMGLLMTQYTYTGYDASATSPRRRRVPRPRRPGAS